jgi:hypothetical protein
MCIDLRPHRKPNKATFDRLPVDLSAQVTLSGMTRNTANIDSAEEFTV